MGAAHKPSTGDTAQHNVTMTDKGNQGTWKGQQPGRKKKRKRSAAAWWRRWEAKQKLAEEAEDMCVFLIRQDLDVPGQRGRNITMGDL